VGYKHLSEREEEDKQPKKYRNDHEYRTLVPAWLVMVSSIRKPSFTSTRTATGIGRNGA
jgi:hypothetical protein